MNIMCKLFGFHNPIETGNTIDRTEYHNAMSVEYKYIEYKCIDCGLVYTSLPFSRKGISEVIKK